MRALAAAIAFAAMGAAAQAPPGVVGKNGWLFYRYEAADANSPKDTLTSVELIARMNRIFARNDVALAVTLVPLKMRLYQRHLPASFPLAPQTAGQYAQLAKALQARGVTFIDLNEPFVEAVKKDPEAPLYFRLDTHWAPLGATTAAQAIRQSIDADARLKPLLDALPARKSTLTWEQQNLPSPANDLVAQLPAGSPKFDKEPVRIFQVAFESAGSASLLGDAPAPGVTLLGSSYSADWTLFPDALRNALQRDVLSISVPANQGSWVGLETYLRDDAYQATPPKILLWELPERDMRAPPDFQYRDARYRVNNTEWLLRAAAWVQRECAASPNSVKAVEKQNDAVEVVFTRPLETLDYVSARVVSHGATVLNVEARGPGAPPRKLDIPSPGDEAAHNFRLSLPPNAGKGYDRVRIAAPTAHRLSVEEAKTCRQPEDLLK